MMLVTQKSQAGFTMIELLVSIVILAIGLLGLAQLQVTAIKTNSQSMTATAARAIAQSVIEDIVALDPASSIFVDGQTGTWGTYTDLEGGGDYTVTYTVSQVKANGNDVSQLFNVSIVVESDEAVMHVLGARKRRVEINTLKRAI